MRVFLKNSFSIVSDNLIKAELNALPFFARTAWTMALCYLLTSAAYGIKSYGTAFTCPVDIAGTFCGRVGRLGVYYPCTRKGTYIRV